MTRRAQNPRDLAAGVPNPEVSEKAGRRVFSAAYKRSIVEQAENCTQRGEIGALLRREGLYSSHPVKWRSKAKSGDLGQKRSPKPAPESNSGLSSSSGRWRACSASSRMSS